MIRFWKKKQKANGISEQYAHLQTLCSDLENIRWWLSQNKQWVSEEVAQQSGHAQSRMEAFRDALLIEIRKHNESMAARRISQGRGIRKDQEAETVL